MSNDYEIKMDGKEATFKGGAIRYTKTGKGCFDLIPKDEINEVIEYAEKITDIDGYFIYPMKFNFTDAQYCAFSGDYKIAILNIAISYYYGDHDLYDIDDVDHVFGEMMLDLAKHYEKGAEKYGVDNWKNGIPEWSFLDSGLRHLSQCMSGKSDEPHHIAAIWNFLGAMWVRNNKPELTLENCKRPPFTKSETDTSENVEIKPNNSNASVVCAKDGNIINYDCERRDVKQYAKLQTTVPEAWLNNEHLQDTSNSDTKEDEESTSEETESDNTENKDEMLKELIKQIQKVCGMEYLDSVKLKKVLTDEDVVLKDFNNQLKKLEKEKEDEKYNLERLNLYIDPVGIPKKFDVKINDVDIGLAPDMGVCEIESDKDKIRAALLYSDSTYILKNSGLLCQYKSLHTLCIKFKSPDLYKKFKTTINDRLNYSFIITSSLDQKTYKLFGWFLNNAVYDVNNTMLFRIAYVEAL